MTSTRPYLIRAFYDWIVDNQCTPHVVVNASEKNVEVPEEYVDGGQIVLNIAVAAVHGLHLGDDAVEFQARFGGRVRRIHAPISSILAIYAKENGRGMVFSEDESDPPPESIETDTENKTKSRKGKGDRSHLTVVK